MTISEYIKNINKRYKTGISREHTYRGDLQNLLEGMLKNVLVTNEPARIACGAPDFILTHKDIPVGYMEAKDIGEPLTGTKHKEQFNRYKESLPNLIFTDYLDFHFYRDGEYVTSVRIAELAGGSIRAVSEAEDKFRQMINDFATHSLQTIKSASKLSKMMAGKARLLSSIIEKALNANEGASDRVNEPANTTLREQLAAFQNVLIHDINAKEFADIYAQTIAYGMFAARLHDTSLDTFSRQEAARLIPKTNPFLRKLFQYIAGYDLDTRIDWVVDALAEIFQATDVNALLTNFGKSTQQTDPIIHFYETFLAEFDPKLRKSRGVWYTPEPVVNFIVRAVDDILKDEFGLKDGLADTSKTKVKVKVPTHDGRFKNKEVEEERQVHKVQILDPAAGTGTFLSEVIKQIHGKFEGQQGIWPDYVENHLIPRLNGFEILMASYAMAHLKLDLLLKETGYDRESDQRFRVYLTNSLEEHHPDTGTLFAGWLSSEANEANHIKRDTPVMVVMGNPPYSVSSSNKGDWITNLIKDYKKDLKEKSINSLSDDYIKFIRFGQHFIEKNGDGILAFISNNSFIDGLVHRKMREQLSNTFDKIFILDLHGDSKKKETTKFGKKDDNVFDIQQGVSINIFIKDGKKDSTSKLYHQDLLGSRSSKYKFLSESKITDITWKEIAITKPYNFFVPKDFELGSSYNTWMSLKDVFKQNSLGIEFGSKEHLVSISNVELKKFIQNSLLNDEISDNEIEATYKIKTTSGWRFGELRKESLQEGFKSNRIKPCLSSPFNIKFTYHSKILRRPQIEVLSNLHQDNIALLTLRQTRASESGCIFVTNFIYSKDAVSIVDRVTGFPLYIYQNYNQQTLDGTPERNPNLNPKTVKKLADGLGLTFTTEKEDTEDTFAPIDLLDYIYAILHSPTYRKTYKEFLKIDFPRVPYPNDPKTFWKLVELGSKLRQVHLMEHPVVNDFITTYPKTGCNKITNRLTKNDPGFIPYDKDHDNHSTPDDHRYPGEKLGKVQINDEQYFGTVPIKAWNFYIGGYQPAEKWLKDRRGRTLSMEEIQHYQKIIVVLLETDRLMSEIDGVFEITDNN
ncbi:DNA methyltransferase [Rhodohalobacter sp. SW132]|uniref:type ISP restriction/modification enzyme n=1 Tax=Rhodohalobacter sp. SW132 TaxID=2293433 RepID=UPI000E22072D|nr:type ISP restriction/modification enzyme [Rhodohalobacter sp. SW132]REL37895.1 DNA methyltransferase [Rhodohalobacter sp. SW132]